MAAHPPHHAAAHRVRRRGGDASPPRERCALLLVDVVNPMQFEGAQAFAPTLARTAERIAALKQHLAARGVPAIYINDRPPGATWRSDFEALVEHCQALGGCAQTLAHRLAPARGDHTLLKPRHSAFYATALDVLLTELGVQQLVVCGIATDSCVQHTAMDAFERGFALWIPSDCTQAESAARQRHALAWMATALQAHTAPAWRRTR